LGDIVPGITAKSIEDQYQISRQQLYYWYKTAKIISPPKKKGSKYSPCEYNTSDLQVIKTISRLKSAGFSTYKIRICFENITSFFPDIANPFACKPIIVFGKTIIFIHNGKAYDAFSGQRYLLDFKKMKKWAGKVIKFQQIETPEEPEIMLSINAEC